MAEGTAIAKAGRRHSEEAQDGGVYLELDVKPSEDFEWMRDVIKCSFLE